MLILSRRKGEQIVVGTGAYTILIRIVDTRGGKVRVGISAPAEVAVDREEVWKRERQWYPNGDQLSAPKQSIYNPSAENNFKETVS